MKKYIVVSGGPTIGINNRVVVKLRELHTENEMFVTAARFDKMKAAGQIDKPAFIPKEKRK